MQVAFSAKAWEEYLHWQDTDRKMIKRINQLIKDIQRSPFEGIGKPEPLKHEWAGFWSRRLDEKHRVIYAVKGDAIEIAQMRTHYGDH